ncbi:hypothetical protein [Streptomyces galbus]|uniref:Uncharacterized protein n=1 Tax=Streptomyces galbus TaxID=33898 RepID=A0A4V6AX98_STRGB|nr:hypothetical protein [Streptomyces galbus]TKT06943.1 hypothetical protein E4U92_24025 [Streptomyces galbus]GHD35256.1 membrane protein [Streptomyces galbus]
MGIESDQVVYEYLSRVGDVAQQRQLSSATRMRLVSDLRNEIDRSRARATVDSPAAVRRIIARLGSPDDVVTAAAEGGGPAVPEPPRPAVPVQREGGTEPARGPRRTTKPRRTEPATADGTEDATPKPDRPRGFRRVVPRPRPAAPAPAAPADVPSPPHRAGTHELGDTTSVPDWWRRGPFGPAGLDDHVPGFVGGVEIPDLLKPPPRKETDAVAEPRPEPVAEPPAAEEAAVRPRRRLLPLPARRWSNPLLLLGALCLVAGAVLGNWFALLLGWLIAYASRRLTDTETKIAVIWLPATAVAAGLAWLWGRSEGRWGTPITDGHLNEAITETWPWVVRGAAIASALFLTWRSQRRT